MREVGSPCETSSRRPKQREARFEANTSPAASPNSLWLGLPGLRSEAPCWALCRDVDVGDGGHAIHFCGLHLPARIPYHNKADGFTAALLLTLNQVKFCELHNCQPNVVWSAFPACKYAGVRFPGRTPFFDASHGTNAFLYFFRPICEGYAKAQQVAPTLTCEQREQVHRVLPWALRTYYYGAARSSAAGGARANET